MSHGIGVFIGFAVAGLVIAAAIGALVAWNRRRSADAHTARMAVIAELERDPALAGLSLRLSARTEWSGETVVEVGGAVPSPWHRYAVVRAVQRALRASYRNARVLDHIVINERAAMPRRRIA
jgi:hypothetical protein